MPASRPDSNSDAVSEVVGQILIFGILSTVLILSLLGFNVAREGAADQVAEVRAESVAQRVAGVVVDAALFAETAEADKLTLRTIIDLPDDLEGHPYVLDLDSDRVIVTVGITTVEAALFSSGAPADVVVCDQSPRGGGPLQVTVSTDFPPGCTNPGDARAIFLEDAP